MLQLIFSALVDMYVDQYHSHTIYSGYGTYIDNLIRDSGLSQRMINKLDWLAYRRADKIMRP